MRAALTLLAFLLVPAAAAAPEGVPLDVGPGDTAWEAPEGDYWLHLVATAPGMSYELPGRTATGPAPACPQDAGGDAGACPDADARFTGASGTLVRLDDEPLVLRVTEGAGRALLARPDLLNATVQERETFGFVRVAGELAEGCRAYAVQTGPFHMGQGARWLEGPLLVQIAAPGMRLTLLDSGLDVLAEGEDALVHALDVPGGADWAVAQACAGEEGGAYAIRVERHDAPERESTQGVPLAAAVPLAALVLAALRRR